MNNLHFNSLDTTSALQGLKIKQNRQQKYISRLQGLILSVVLVYSSNLTCKNARKLAKIYKNHKPGVQQQ